MTRFEAGSPVCWNAFCSTSRYGYALLLITAGLSFPAVALISGWISVALAITVVLALVCSSIAMTVVSLRLQHRLHKGREGDHLLVANASDAMLLLRVRRSSLKNNKSLSFIIQSANPAAVGRIRSFGHADGFLEKNIDEVFPSSVKQKAKEEYIACVTTKQTRRYKITPPGGTVTLESIAAPIFDATGEAVTHIAVITRDIVEHVRQERELADALWEARQANKSKAEFLASMSHELRMPLNAVLGYSEMLQREIGGDLSQKHQEYARYIHQSGSHLLKIIGDILDLSKIEAGKFALAEEEASVPPLISECMSMVRERAANKGLQLNTNVPDGLPVFRIDSLRFKQIVLNLLSNAIKFTTVGNVTLTISFDMAVGLLLSVQDTGIGMSRVEVAIALEPFGQVESAMTRNHDGTGLGLPIAIHLVALHGGKLSLESEPGRGTTVHITLPVERAVMNGNVDREAKSVP